MKSTLLASRKLGNEFTSAEFGDLRLTRRLQSIVDTLSIKPNVGFPMAFANEAASEGFYRFLRNAKVSDERILKPHVDATVTRCAELDSVIVVHDTTEFQFGGRSEREGLGTTGGRKKGFFGHIALAVDSSAHNRPLGVLGLRTFSRTKKKYSRGTRAEYLRKLRRDPTKESLRWAALLESVEGALRDRASVIHVMDRESDNYTLVCKMDALAARFVIRATAKRKLFPLGEGDPVPGINEDWKTLPVVLEREVPLSPRHPAAKGRPPKPHPIRKQRIATLQFSAKSIRIRRSSNARKSEYPEFIELNAVRVFEVGTPRGEEPVEWLLLTNEPIATPTDVARIVDAYRVRWTIEEFFKALKTGCAFETRQLESLRTLKNALAILLPIACKLLLLRSVERHADSVRADDIATKQQIEVLRAFSSRSLSRHPTPQEILSSIAALGGHLTSNGSPGWQILWRGYQELLTLERAWTTAIARQRSDQS